MKVVGSVTVSLFFDGHVRPSCPRIDYRELLTPFVYETVPDHPDHDVTWMGRSDLRYSTPSFRKNRTAWTVTRTTGLVYRFFSSRHILSRFVYLD